MTGTRAERPLVVDPWTTAMAMASLAAAAIHFAAIRDHFDESAVYGSLFAVVAWSQALWAAVVLAGMMSRPVLLAGLVGNLAVVAVWALTRTLGVPLGPMAGEVEPARAVDMCAVIAQLAVANGCAWLLTGNRAPVVVARRLCGRSGAIVAGVAVITTWAMVRSTGEPAEVASDTHLRGQIASDVIARVDGSFVWPDGTQVSSMGVITVADGTVLNPQGGVVHGDGSVMLESGEMLSPTVVGTVHAVVDDDGRLVTDGDGVPQTTIVIGDH